MPPIEPDSVDFRAAAFALILIAGFTAAMIAANWGDRLDGPVLIALVVGYFLFNIGYVWFYVKARLKTKGARVGAAAVSLNGLAMLCSDFVALWTALSAVAVPVALVGALICFQDAKRTPA